MGEVVGGVQCKRMNSMIISRSSANCRAKLTKRGWMDVVGGLTKYTVSEMKLSLQIMSAHVHPHINIIIIVISRDRVQFV